MMKGSRIARKFMLRVKWRVTLSLAVTLLLVIVLLVAVGERRQREKLPGIEVMQGGYLIANVGTELMERLEQQSVTYQGSEYTAVSLDDILERVHATPTLYESAVCAGNRKSVEISGGKFIENSGYVVAYAQGEKGIEEEKGGPFLLLQVEEDASGAFEVTGDIGGLESIMVSLRE